LWTFDIIEKNRLLNAPQNLVHIVVGIDPSISAGEESNETGIIVCARDNQKPLPHYYVLDDLSLSRATPDTWARRAIAGYNKWKADKLIAEVNQAVIWSSALSRLLIIKFRYCPYTQRGANEHELNPYLHLQSKAGFTM
jgi:phage terminase large subunit-like protein